MVAWSPGCDWTNLGRLGHGPGDELIETKTWETSVTLAHLARMSGYWAPEECWRPYILHSEWSQDTQDQNTETESISFGKQRNIDLGYAITPYAELGRSVGSAAK